VIADVMAETPTLLEVEDAFTLNGAPTYGARLGFIAVPFPSLFPPRAQLAVLPGTTHVRLIDRTEWLVSMISSFLDAPAPEAK
jgi:hypothetical protein